ncbi:hypothetical protein AVEN_101127-1 [Araneus ventricosus]|uniref:Uncharacterized protein n=1 Tax=Araneus ventricosus TaxID=182803 RepID=A0A4Y2QJ64_ARAVE|nr:hypothetical protein AVEN_101127-1 [Araneus ventricosus]
MQTGQTDSSIYLDDQKRPDSLSWNILKIKFWRKCTDQLNFRTLLRESIFCISSEDKWLLQVFYRSLNELEEGLLEDWLLLLISESNKLKESVENRCHQCIAPKG